ncbi:hypothetical protein CEXT_341351 [Caerostris extrusa]|uniref:Uncharacterized protein n=1 Tax=Caerostris extrusa TaxID=172846 RepID=A0AAV4SSX9_CAEEX|nr:hypothetical protein CEXT_341351 [Caerostris extrusa]
MKWTPEPNYIIQEVLPLSPQFGTKHPLDDEMDPESNCIIQEVLYEQLLRISHNLNRSAIENMLCYRRAGCVDLFPSLNPTQMRDGYKLYLKKASHFPRKGHTGNIEYLKKKLLNRLQNKRTIAIFSCTAQCLKI